MVCERAPIFGDMNLGSMLTMKPTRPPHKGMVIVDRSSEEEGEFAVDGYHWHQVIVGFLYNRGSLLLIFRIS